MIEMEMAKSGNHSKSSNSMRMTLMNIAHFMPINCATFGKFIQVQNQVDSELLSLKTFPKCQD